MSIKTQNQVGPGTRREKPHSNSKREKRLDQIKATLRRVYRSLVIRRRTILIVISFLKLVIEVAKMFGISKRD